MGIQPGIVDVQAGEPVIENARPVSGAGLRDSWSKPKLQAV